ncbi:hypothetical protein ST47_g5906 [Ascochyta rabiei]|uniref:Heterokaryon incompatibility domain-containing protein n=1 Tax=Didymella rabiei TaxID=5454 RepID=A0A163D6V6_DIDRA|nr:hypothetical protein ST47_g5906 [Ascochyta rabiei]
MFQHSPLDHNKSSIRLIEILPSLSREGHIQCTISHHTIEASYDCLSYRWGDPLPEAKILVNGQPFSARWNLFDFLDVERLKREESSLRMMHFSADKFNYPKSSVRSSDLPKPTTQTRLLWIDALCIDQKNNLERDHQVAQMGKIFSQANTVYVWLGTMPILSQLSIIHSGQLSSILKFSRRRHLPFDDPIQFWNSHDFKNEFFLNEYWSRAWITQELYLAQSAILVLKHQKNIDLRDVYRMLYRVIAFAPYPHPLSLFNFLGNVFSNRDASRSLGDDFAQLLHTFRATKCSVPRDRIFSILPLYRWSKFIRVDYEKADDELAVDVLNCRKEPTQLCRVAVMARSLLPQSSPLGTGFLDLDILISDFHWGPLQISHIPMSKARPCHEQGSKPPPCYSRPLESVDYHYYDTPLSTKGIRDHECKIWVLARKLFLTSVTLVGIPANRAWDELSVEGTATEVPLGFARHRSKDHPKALPVLGNRKKWRMYGKGISFRPIEEGNSGWAMRISLCLVWDMVKSWNRLESWGEIEPCAYACGAARVGYEVPDG